MDLKNITPEIRAEIKYAMDAYAFIAEQHAASLDSKDPEKVWDDLLAERRKTTATVRRALLRSTKKALQAEVKEQHLYIKGGVTQATSEVLAQRLADEIVTRDEESEAREHVKKVSEAASVIGRRRFAIEEADKTLRHWATLVEGTPEQQWRIYESMQDALADLGRIYIWHADGTPVDTQYSSYTERNPEPLGVEGALEKVGQIALYHLLTGEKTNLNMLQQVRANEVFPFMMTDLAYKQVVSVALGALSEGGTVEVSVNNNHLVDFRPRGW